MADRPRPDREQGVFETLLVVGGRPVELDAHLGRLENSLAELFPGRPVPDLQPEIEHLTAGVELGSVRATVAPEGGRTLRTRVELRPPRGAFVSLSDRKAPRPVGLHSLVLAGGLGAHKWADRSLLDGAQAGLPAGALPLVVDSDGAVLEAARANVFALRGGSLFTPPTDGRILPGVTRARVLELAASAGLETHETELSRDDLLAADEVFLTGSVRGLERVRSVDGTELGDGGEVAADLGAELWRTWAGAQVG